MRVACIVSIVALAMGIVSTRRHLHESSAHLLKLGCPGVWDEGAAVVLGILLPSLFAIGIIAGQ